MTITLFVEPNSFPIFIQVTKTLEGLLLENNYYFNPCDLVFSEAAITNWFQINMSIEEYFKLKYCIGKLS
jgi:hypothetical protein